jgi:hypothetical protein
MVFRKFGYLSTASGRLLVGLASRKPGQEALGILGVSESVLPVLVSVDASISVYPRNLWFEHELFESDSVAVIERLPTIAPFGTAVPLATPKAEGMKDAWTASSELGESRM